MKKLLIASLLFVMCSISMYAQDDSAITERIHYKHGLGLAAGATTGYGLSYRYCPSRWSFQGTFAPFKDSYSSDFSLGLAVLYNIVETNRTSFFAYEGNHFLSHKTNGNMWSPAENDQHFNNGLGIGIEFIFYKRVSFNLMAGYGFYNNFKEINVTGETGLFYKF